MKKPIIATTTIVILGILYSIFLHKKSEYVAGEYRYYTEYQKYKANKKSYDFSPKAYEEDIYNLIRLKDKANNEIDQLEGFRIKLNSLYNSIYSPNNSVSDYEEYLTSLKELTETIEDRQTYYKQQKKDLNDLKEFIVEIEQDLYSIKFYEIDIYHVSSVINSIDSTASKYINSAKFLKIASAAKGLELVKQILHEKERKHQELLAQIQLQTELEKWRKERESNYSKNLSSYSSSNHVDYTIWSNSYNNYSNISIPAIPNYPSYDLTTTQFYSTNTNPIHVEVEGFYKSNGTYVESHMRTAKNNTIIDNFSTSPNLNPYTGKIGTIKFKQ